MSPQVLAQQSSEEQENAANGTSNVPSSNDSSLELRSDDVPNQTLFSQSFTLTIGQGSGQLSSVKNSNPIELSIPREIISSSLSSTILQAELVRPIIAGTYHGEPAYLMRLQFQLQPTSNGQSLMSRIQNASISALLEDAPIGKKAGPSRGLQWDRKRRPARVDSLPEHPAFVETFPGPEGWEGPPSVADISTFRKTGIHAGWNTLGANTSWGDIRSREELGVMKMTAVRNGSQRNSLLVNVAENPVQMVGVPSYLDIPLILTHHSRRFSMRVSVSARFGFWQDKLAEMVPVLGRADEPLYFDPSVLQKMMEIGETGIGGVKVVEWGDKLDGVDLQMYSSLANNN